MVDQKLNSVVAKRVELTKELLLIYVKPEGWELPTFMPGQYCTVGLPDEMGKLVRRVYSISSSPLEKEYLELYIVIVPDGKLTPRLFRSKERDKLWLSKRIVGLFTLDKIPGDQNIILAGTGTGLAPYMSMLRTGLAKDSSRKVAVIHGVRFSPDLSFKDELEAMDRDNVNFSYIGLVSRPHKNPTPWSGLMGHVQDIWGQDLIEKAWGFKPLPQNTHVFLCGHPGMVEDMTGLLEQEGFKEHSRNAPGQIHIEKYW